MPDDETDSVGLDLRWCRLTQIKSGDEPIEILAATQDDGVGIFARWRKLMNEEWHLEVMSTESGVWEPGGAFYIQGIPRVPPSTFDNVAPVQPELSKEELECSPSCLHDEKMQQYIRAVEMLKSICNARVLAANSSHRKVRLRLNLKFQAIEAELRAIEDDLPDKLFP